MTYPRVYLRVRAQAKGEGGITMVEMIMAIFVFAVVMASLVPVFATSLRVTGTNRNRSVAANLAAQEMDIVRGATFTSLPVGQVTATQTVDGVAYTITRDSEWITQNATSGPCTGGASGSTLAFLRVTVTVDWPNRGGIPLVRSQTVVTPPVGAYNTNSGNIAVLVVNATGAPASGHLVTLTGPTNSTQVTPADGCAFFAFLPTGAYTVSLNTASYVDQQGVPNPSQPASVNVGTTTSIQFVYDRAATLVLTFVGQNGGNEPNNAAVMAANTTLLPNGTKVFPGTGSPRTIGGLFPFTAGYQVWAGDCLDADPEGLTAGGTPYWPGAVRASPLATLPGQTTSGAVQMSTLGVTVLQGGLPVPDAQIQAVHLADAGCPSGNTLTFTGSTDANGVLDLAMPYGTWEIQVTGRSPAGAWPSVVLDPRVATTTNLTVDVV